MAAAAAMTAEAAAGDGPAARAPGWTAPAVQSRTLAGAEASLPFPRPGVRAHRARSEGDPLATIAWERHYAESWQTDQRRPRRRRR